MDLLTALDAGFDDDECLGLVDECSSDEDDEQDPVSPRLLSVLQAHSTVVPVMTGIQLSVFNIEAFHDILPGRPRLNSR